MVPAPSPPTPVLLPPPGPIVHVFSIHPTGEISYTPSSATPPSQLFCDALTIRANVFILEQKCPADEEIDADDGLSWHWVIYAPGESESAVSTDRSGVGDEGADIAGQVQPRAREADDGELQKIAASKGTTEELSERDESSIPPSLLPAATIRLVPTQPHPHASSIQTASGPTYTNSKIWDQTEAYVKIGRLATVAAYRGRGYGRVLLHAALAFAGRHKGEMVMEGVGEWKGLMLAHAQREVEGWYRGLGWEPDEGMGRWDEAGIEHVGMWKRVVVEG